MIGANAASLQPLQCYLRRDPYKIWHTLKHMSKTSKARNLKFGIWMHINNFSKMDK